MKNQYEKEQPFRFEVNIEVFAKDFNYNVAMKKIIDEASELNYGEIIIREIKGNYQQIHHDEAKQAFNFEIIIEFFMKDFDYDTPMRKVIESVHKLNAGEVVMKEIKGEQLGIIV